jgi:UDP-N-acetylglucosamine 2-epimerase
MSPLIRECEKQGLDYFVLHTSQHYSYNLDNIFFEALELPAAKYNLDVGSGTHAEETEKMLIGIEKILDGLKLVYETCNHPILYPIHPRTMKRLKEFGLEVPNGVDLIEPLGFLEFLQVEAK